MLTRIEVKAANEFIRYAIENKLISTGYVDVANRSIVLEPIRAAEYIKLDSVV